VWVKSERLIARGEAVGAWGAKGRGPTNVFKGSVEKGRGQCVLKEVRRASCKLKKASPHSTGEKRGGPVDKSGGQSTNVARRLGFIERKRGGVASPREETIILA